MTRGELAHSLAGEVASFSTPNSVNTWPCTDKQDVDRTAMAGVYKAPVVQITSYPLSVSPHGKDAVVLDYHVYLHLDWCWVALFGLHHATGKIQSMLPQMLHMNALEPVFHLPNDYFTSASLY